MFTVFDSRRPNSVASRLVDLQVQRWHAEQSRGPTQDGPRRQLRDSAQARLQASPYLSLRRLYCDGEQGEVTIRGRVPTQYLKELSAMLVRSIEGVRRVRNEVEVLPLGWGQRAGLVGGA